MNGPFVEGTGQAKMPPRTFDEWSIHRRHVRGFVGSWHWLWLLRLWLWLMRPTLDGLGWAGLASELGWAGLGWNAAKWILERILECRRM